MVAHPLGSNCSGELGVKAVPSLWCVPHLGVGRWSSGHGERRPVVLLRADRGAWLVWLSPIQLLELEDEADEWGPPGSDRCCGTRMSEMEREEQDRGSKDISRAHAD